MSSAAASLFKKGPKNIQAFWYRLQADDKALLARRGAPYTAWESIGFIALKASHEAAAASRSGGNSELNQKECIFESWVGVNEAILSPAEKAKLWEDMPPQMRRKFVVPYADLNFDQPVLELDDKGEPKLDDEGNPLVDTSDPDYPFLASKYELA